MSCKYCPYYYTIWFSGQKHRCLLKPEYILDKFSKRKPKWCPLKKKEETANDRAEID